MARNDARKNCSSFGSTVHLPIPRFFEEYEFYRAHFGNIGQLNDHFKGLSPSLAIKNNHHYFSYLKIMIKTLHNGLTNVYVKNLRLASKRFLAWYIGFGARRNFQN